MNPKYQMVADALRAGILEGKYSRTLPTEQALCAQYQVSRQTGGRRSPCWRRSG